MSNEITRSDLDRFLEKVLELQSTDVDQVLTGEELREIAFRVGLSEDEWERIRSELAACLSRGTNFLECGNAEDAILDLDQAAVLAPYRPDVLLACAEAHHLRWKESGDEAAKKRAKEGYEKCLRIEPGNSRAAKGLSNLKTEGQRSTSTKVWRKRVAIASVVLLALISTGYWYLSAKVEPWEVHLPGLELPVSNSASPLSMAEVSEWLLTKELYFEGWLATTLRFQPDHVEWEQKGKIWKHQYTVEPGGVVKIHAHEEFILEFSDDLEQGTFESRVGKYRLTITQR